MASEKGALGAMVRALRSSGMEARVEGDDIVATPQTEWYDEEFVVTGPALDELELPGVSVTFRVGSEERAASVEEVPVKENRYWFETRKPLSVSAPPGEKLSVVITAKNGKSTRDLVRGELVVPDKVHNMGAPGIFIVPRALRDAFVFLHVAEVDGERRIIAAHASLHV